jgi:hypothetical protein
MGSFAEAARHLVGGLNWRDGEVFRGLDRLKWRHHGLGMLQAEFSEALRIHVWHLSLVCAEMAWPRCVHDHRFDLESAVVAGAVRDVLPDVRPFGPSHPSGGWQRAKMYEIEHAKNQDRLVKGGCSTATSARLLGEIVVTSAHASWERAAGTTYQVKRRVFHTTEVDSLAVTVVHRSNFDDALARVLCAPDADVTAVSGIVRDDSPEHAELVRRVLAEAESAVWNL